MTLHEALNINIVVTHKTLKELGINSKKEWEETTVGELESIADDCDVMVADLF